MNETEIKRAMLKEVIKKTISRIKVLQKDLEKAKEVERVFGTYDDCGDSYITEVERIEAVIKELVQQKISLEKWRKLLGHQQREILEDEIFLC